MTREEIEKLPGIIDTMLDESVAVYVGKKIHEKITGVCNMAIEALSAEPCEDAISRAEAEALFRNARSKLNPSDYKTADEFNTRDLMLLNAEQFIHLLPSVTLTCSEKPNNCEDAISRQAAIDAAIDGADDWDGGYNPTREEYIKKAINALPPVNPKQKMGRWKDRYRDVFKYYCSKCETGSDLRTSYCPNCGAKMESED